MILVSGEEGRSPRKEKSDNKPVLECVCSDESFLQCHVNHSRQAAQNTVNIGSIEVWQCLAIVKTFENTLQFTTLLTCTQVACTSAKRRKPLRTFHGSIPPPPEARTNFLSYNFKIFRCFHHSQHCSPRYRCSRQAAGACRAASQSRSTLSLAAAASGPIAASPRSP